MPESQFVIPIIFENEDYIAFSKPSGLPTAPRATGSTNLVKNTNSLETTTLPGQPKNLVEYVLQVRPKISKLDKVSHHSYEPGLLHRLDNETSGAVLFAKTENGFLHAHQLWKNNQVTKIYRARSTSNDPQKFEPTLLRLGKIEFPIGHSNKSARKMVAIVNENDLRKIRGKPQTAVTEILESKILDASASLLGINETGQIQGVIETTLSLHTGVRHQIRIHLSALGAPLLGDRLYKGTPSSRLWLHAESLSFLDQNGQKVFIRSPAW